MWQYRHRGGAVLLMTILLIAAGCRGGETPEHSAAAEETTWRPPAQDAGYSTGLEDAPVTVVEFSDFGCPYCAQFALNTYPDLHSEFVLSGKVRWIFVPFVIGRFQNGDAAALAAECVGEQGRFWPMHDLVYERQADWRREGSADALFLELATSAGADPARFQECYRENRPAARIENHNELARRAGVRGTPSFVVNGRLVQGALPPEQFRAVLEWAVTTAN